MGAVAPIKVDGLRDLQAALKAMDGEAQKQLRVVFNAAGASVVRGAANRVPSRTGAARKSLRATSGQREAKVTGGSKQVPYYGWLDFGGLIPRGGRGRLRRSFLTQGRYMYPAYSANHDSIAKALQNSIVDLARNAGLGVSDSG